MKCLLRSVVVAFLIAGCSRGPSSPDKFYPNYSTPESAFESYEIAIGRNDVDGAVEATDFRQQAKESFSSANINVASVDQDVVSKAAAELEAIFRKRFEAYARKPIDYSKCKILNRSQQSETDAHLAVACNAKVIDTVFEGVHLHKNEIGWHVVWGSPPARPAAMNQNP